METVNNIVEIGRQLSNKGYDLSYINEIIIGERYNLTYNEYHNIVEINVYSRDYWNRLNKESFIGFENYTFIISYSGEKSNRPPNNILCKMKPEEREKILSLYKK